MTWEHQLIRRREHDACGIVAVVQKDSNPSHDNVEKVIRSLIQMSHRAGFVEGEGDGCGILLDIPRELWAHKLAAQGLSGTLAEKENFVVGHFFLTKEKRGQAEYWVEQLRQRIRQASLNIVWEQTGHVRSGVLGPLGAADEPLFLQMALSSEEKKGSDLATALFSLACQVEEQLPFHVVSLSKDTVIYKVRGSANILPEYFPDLQSEDCRSAVSIGHNRYSTNTSTVFERVQPFSLLGHNGEINTIRKLREEAEMAGIPLIDGASDSQDLNRIMEGLIHRYGLSLFETMEIIFPPIINEIKQFSPKLQDLYMFFRSMWGPFAQGPAGIVSHYGDECVFSVDALGLRPLWMVETPSRLFFSSEQGVVPLAEMVAEPKPLAPGEKIGLKLRRGHSVEVFPYHRLQEEVLQRAQKKFSFAHFRRAIGFGTPSLEMGGEDMLPGKMKALSEQERERLLAAWGWDADDLHMIEHEASTGAEPIRSLGFDGPLAVLSRERQNLADFFKESVAVVTNPAIDREREIEHFSTRVVLGPRPSLRGNVQPGTRRVELQTPLLFGGHLGKSPLEWDMYRPLAHEMGTYLFEDLLQDFARETTAVRVLDAVYSHGETLPEAVRRLQKEAVAAVQDGAHMLVLDDRAAFRHGNGWLDPHLVVSAVHLALKNHQGVDQPDNLRRRTSIVLRSGALRNLHDLALAFGLGADAVNPYMMWEVAAQTEPVTGLKNLYLALQKGLEKVISTIGIHELRGYGRLFSSIGLKPELAQYFAADNFFGSEQAGYGFAELEQEAEKRLALVQQEEPAKVARTFHYFPRIWKLAGDVAAGLKPFSAYAEKVMELEQTQPISLRHLLAVRTGEQPAVDPQEVDLSVGEHDLPFLISSMSLGSQNETAYRAYAEAAYRLNMISLNGEGGEIKDLIGKYPKNRGMQIASGRFGVNIELVNSSHLLEIKIGQGAKPGEGGHLPGSKVSLKVAAARNATPGTDLISPSNNHDIYSIEDLAQMIDELKTANPYARVAVKVPVVPGIGTIAVGIAKAGADIVALSGFDGGTGAARAHAIKYVGLPIEIGVKMAHQELVQSGLRDKVEIWADGGMKTGLDVLKLMLLGANRVGFGTMAMIAVGCTACRGCHKDTCHVGIATQMESMEEAKEKGLKVFKPRVFDQAVENLCRFFTGVGEHLREWTARLGVTKTQELVGRSDLLQQVAEKERIDLQDLLRPVKGYRLQTERILQARSSSLGENSLTERLAREAEEEVAAGRDVFQCEMGGVDAHDRVLGSYLSGTVTRGRFRREWPAYKETQVRLGQGSIGGNGLAAYNAPGVSIRVCGGAQDGVGKTSYGGKIVILKSKNKDGQYLDGSVGKGLAYGAQKGLFLIQGNADSRAGIRLSGADVLIGGQLKEPIDDSKGMIGTRANIKGFAFEYMTNGRAVVLGDPGPWICSGMTGGVVYVRYQPEMGLNDQALRRRIAKGARVTLQPIDEQGKRDLVELLTLYQEELAKSDQHEEAALIQTLIVQPELHFRMIKPGAMQTDQEIATE